MHISDIAIEQSACTMSPACSVSVARRPSVQVHSEHDDDGNNIKESHAF